MVNLCSFFTTTFGGICGFTSPLSKCCDALKLNATAQFKTSINESINDARGRASQAAIRDALRAVADVTNHHRNSALSDAFDIGSLIESYAAGLRVSIGECGEGPVVQLNALFDLLVVCRDANLQCRAAVADDVENLLGKITAGEVDELCRRCRVGDVIQAIHAASGAVISTIRGLEPDLVRAAIRRLETTLVGSGPIITPVVDLLQNVELRQRARKDVADRLAQIYELLFNVVTDPANGYDSPGTMFKHTPALIRDMMMV
jgi:hypothetical protein